MNSSKLSVFLLFLVSGPIYAALKPLSVDEINSYSSTSLKFTAVTGWASLPSGTPITLSLKLEITDKKFDPSGKLTSGIAKFSVFQNSKDGDQYEDQWARVHCKELNTLEAITQALAKENIKTFDIQGIRVLLPEANLLGPSPLQCPSFEAIEVNP